VRRWVRRLGKRRRVGMLAEGRRGAAMALEMEENGDGGSRE
jgi:hypothetical protein